MNNAKLRVLNPEGVSQVAQVDAAKRPRQLDGLSIGFLDNTKNNTDRILGALEESMKKAYGIKSVTAIKETSNRPADPKLLASMAERCDALVTGIGD